ncbi:unnamed protein product [Vitrella brassicaformis CCMP3155]|uniref:FAM86 N-terminal domain-containing protein n=1 Tax=Vitrella brassicaformis (strain CCMP3155) TaxID=1169540 RepID=A0A0G4FL14_VITBC|nr:unnamed protein product [Vitrella brassicaformis CCMP3155]|eukprot:CEM14664.1 unnamed protein product [Vitrella brassicaformis CCMP3155]
MWDAEILQLGGPSSVRIKQETNWEKACTVGLGAVVWEAGISLATMMLDRLPDGFFDNGVGVVEIGAGTGVCGLVCADKGARRVRMTDRPEVLPLIAESVALNSHLKDSGRIEVAPLLWHEASPADFRINTDDESSGSRRSRPYDLLIASGSDIFDDLRHALQVYLFTSCVESAPGSSGPALLSFEERADISLHECASLFLPLMRPFHVDTDGRVRHTPPASQTAPTDVPQPQDDHHSVRFSVAKSFAAPSMRGATSDTPSAPDPSSLTLVRARVFEVNVAPYFTQTDCKLVAAYGERVCDWGGGGDRVEAGAAAGQGCGLGGSQVFECLRQALGQEHFRELTDADFPS